MSLSKKVEKFIKDNEIEEFKFVGKDLIVLSCYKINKLPIPVRFETNNKLISVSVTPETFSNFDLRSYGITLHFKKGIYDLKGKTLPKDCLYSFQRGCVILNAEIHLLNVIDTLGFVADHISLSGLEFVNCKLIGNKIVNFNNCDLDNCEIENNHNTFDICKVNNIKFNPKDSNRVYCVRFNKSSIFGLTSNSLIFDFQVLKSSLSFSGSIKITSLAFNKVDFNHSVATINYSSPGVFKSCTNYGNVQFVPNV